MGIDVSLLVGQHKETAICLSALQTDLTYLWTTWLQGRDIKHRHVHLPWGFGEGLRSSQSPLTSLSFLYWITLENSILTTFIFSVRKRLKEKDFDHLCNYIVTAYI